jgi:hypothetical protein
LFFAYFFLLVFGLQAQTQDRFIQRLKWQDSEYASSYEVVVQRLGDLAAEGLDDASESAVEVLREKTAEVVLDCSLRPGRYRYQVTAFNLLGRTGAVSDWMPFEVLPVLPDSEKESFIHHLFWESDEYAYYYEAVVDVKDGDDYREVLRNNTSDTALDCSLPPGQYRFRVIAFNYLGKEGAVSDAAYFEVLPVPRVVEIPAPPSDEDQPPITEEPEPAPIAEEPPAQDDEPILAEPDAVDVEEDVPHALPVIMIAASYSPIDVLPNSYFNRTYAMQFLPVGGSLHIDFMFFEKGANFFGLELLPSYNYLSSDTKDYSVFAHLMSAHLNLLYQRWLFNKKMALAVSLGGGISYIYDFHFEYSGKRATNAINTFFPSASGGLAFLYFINEHFFVEAGAEFLHRFSVDNSYMEYIRPAVSAGWKF